MSLESPVSNFEIQTYEIESIFLNHPVSFLCVISGFRRGVNEVLALLGCYSSLTGTELQTFRDNPSAPLSWSVKHLKIGQLDCPVKSVSTSQRCVTSLKSLDVISKVLSFP